MENHSLNVATTVTALLHHCQFGVTFRGGGEETCRWSQGSPFSAVRGPAASQWTVVTSAESTTPRASAHKVEFCSRSLERGQRILNLQERTGII